MKMTPAAVLFLALVPVSAGTVPLVKKGSSFFPGHLVEIARRNAEETAWGRRIREGIVTAAEPWFRFSDEELWGLMFGDTLKRSWMVRSDGSCPTCRKDVPMYNWKIDALERPWKVQCPHCSELFPKNHFEEFYRSGLDEHGVFDPALADRSLLYNAEHPDPDDPLHRFGVDDGTGFSDGKTRWWFVGAYLIYGQWKQLVVGGIRNLSAAYVLTGDFRYAHKAGILLDRVADLYPTFDFREEGVMYEGPGAAGYVSTWHDACEETRQLALAYDEVFEGLRRDPSLVEFLSRQAEKYHLPNPKKSFADIQRNIEERILHDALTNKEKIRSNYPRREIALAVIRTVLGWPGNRDEVLGFLEEVIGRAAAVDGVTGEKGLANYSAFVLQSLAQLLARYNRLEKGFLSEMIRRIPDLRKTWRFHIDTWCLQRYYPLIGDTGDFAKPIPTYRGVSFTTNPGLNPSMFKFLWDLYEATGDPDYVRVLVLSNRKKSDGLPFDLFETDPPGFRERVEAVIRREGESLKLESLDKREWHLAILRSGEADTARAVWLDYDAGGSHGHKDGLNLGLFAYGLDLLPDFGYPPVQFGGWNSPRSLWYRMTAAHNTVVVDGHDQKDAAGKTTYRATGEGVQVIRVSADDLYETTGRYDRTVLLADLPDENFYVVDVFSVSGGREHIRLFHSAFGRVTTRGLSLGEVPTRLPGTQMRRFRESPPPESGWSADWTIEDPYGYSPRRTDDLHLRIHDLTENASAGICEAWIAPLGFGSTEETWIPCIYSRRLSDGEEALRSTFLSVLEPYEHSPQIRKVSRLKVETQAGESPAEPCPAVEILFADESAHLIVFNNRSRTGDSEHLQRCGAILQRDWGIDTEKEIAFFRRSSRTDPPEEILLNKNNP